MDLPILLLLLLAAGLGLLLLPELRRRPGAIRRGDLFRHKAMWIALSIAASLALSLALGGRAIVLLGALPLLGLFGGGRRGARPTQGSPLPSRPPMTRDEAHAVLGLEPDASVRAIESAYARLRARIDPGQGGSAWLAAELDAARETLLGGQHR